MHVLTEAASAIAPYLCFIFQQSIDTGSVPADWKHANIIAVYKKCSRMEVHNYWPVSLTSVSCKLLEHIMFRHIMTHLDAHNVLVDHQHGFRSNHSCGTQLINTIEHLAHSINYRNQTDLSRCWISQRHLTLLRTSVCPWNLNIMASMATI